VTVLETERLVLRRMSIADAGFILRLLNEPSFLRYIGDKGVRTEADAGRYILTGPMESYERLGFGLYLVELKETGEAIGMCGLLKRGWLPHVDVGFAFLPRFWSMGYAFEAASTVLAHARQGFRLQRILAIASPDNVASINLLAKLGFRPEGSVALPPEEADVSVFGRDL
jgi:RimJ/RimL family protein N-acetyltransferase